MSHLLHLTDTNQGTKYFGGHSDLLCGVLVVKTRGEWDQVCCKSYRIFYKNILTRTTTDPHRPHIPWEHAWFAGVLVAPSLFAYTSPEGASSVGHSDRFG